ncbi:hypothetical protein B0H14DRAFT_2643830 [Mycena olivaceomarginata]|nr:hypothetical protein B0H14DRAFT_2643830 [Mycena olivaceomarginata]
MTRKSSSSQTPFQTGSTDTYYYFLSEFVAAARRNFARDIARAIAHRRRWEVGAGLTLSSSNVSEDAQVWAQISAEPGYWGSGRWSSVGWTGGWTGSSVPNQWETASSGWEGGGWEGGGWEGGGWEGGVWESAPSDAADGTMTATGDASQASPSPTIVALS